MSFMCCVGLCLVTQLCPTLCDSMDCMNPHVPTGHLCSMGVSRQKYWSGLPCPPPEDLPDPGTEPRSPTLQAASFLSQPPGKPKNTGVGHLLSKESCPPRNKKLRFSCIAGGFFTS